MTTTRHIRVGVVRAGRRINDSRGSAGRTICGAELTAYDTVANDAKQLSAAMRDEWITCADCRAWLEVQA